MKNLYLFLFLFVFSFTSVAQTTLKGFGDSNTDFWIDLPQTQKWLHLVGQELNLTVSNYASAGATIYSINGLINQKNNASTGSKDYATFMFGTNDANQNIINPQWKTDYKNYIQHFINEGYDPNKLFIISPNFDPSDNSISHYLPQVSLARQYCSEIATELGIKYVDLYGEMKVMFDAFADPQLSLSVYAKAAWMLVGGKHLFWTGHRLLADIFKKKLSPPQHIAGQNRVKLFGAGSAMAGISSYHHSFVELFGNETGRHPANFAIAGTGISDLNLTQAASGEKDIMIVLFGNNDGNGSDSWKTLFKAKITDVISLGYSPQNIVLMTVSRAPNLEINHNYNWNRIGAANVRIREIANELATKLIDLEMMFNQSSQFSDDYHINDVANEVVAQALKSLFPAPNPGGCGSVPTITASGSTSICQGSSVTLTSSSSNNEWLKNGTVISGATGNSYAATESGDYTIRVSNGSCTLTSTPITVTVNATPSVPVITASGSTTICNGNNVSLSTTATGSLQWYKDGVAINGATTQTYIATASGNYTVVAGANGCSASSSAITVTIHPVPSTPTINVSGSASFCQGGSVSLTSTTTDGNQWYKDGVAINGATAQTYTANSNGNYTVTTTTGSCSSSPSTPITVTVNATPSVPVITASGSTTVCNGNNVSLSTTATGSLQWHKDGVVINGATTQTYTATASGNYTVVAGANGCSASSSAITVTVNPVPSTPTINVSGSAIFCQGGSVSLTSTTTDGNQWYKDGVAINGATTQTYTANSNGNYTVTTTTGSCSSSPSSPITVTVNAIPSTPAITTNGATTFCNGGSVILSSSNNSGNQWYKDGVAINGATAQTYNATASGDYTAETTINSCTSPVSSPVTVTVIAAPSSPTITASGSTAICEGSSVILNSSASADNQWYKDGVAINGATDQTYTTNTDGNYQVSASLNSCTSGLSSSIVITTNTPPADPLITALGATTFCEGGSVTLSSSNTTGNQWYRNGQKINGATGESYTASIPGNYRVITIVNGCTSNTSSSVTVTVNPLPSTPFITTNGNTLLSSSSSRNQWFLNDTLIDNATNQSFNAHVSGSYKVAVTVNGCSALSASYNFTKITVDSSLSLTTVKFYPNPVQDWLNIKNSSNKRLSVRIVNAQGAVIYQQMINTGIHMVETKTLMRGAYFLSVTDVQTMQSIGKTILKQ